jgi:hypothetical protein
MTLTRSLYATVASLLVVENALAAGAGGFFGQTKADGLKGGTSATSGFDAISQIIVGLLSLITIVAVAYVLWAGFQILTAGGDEEKVKTGRKTIINVIIGIVIMWLAYWVVSLVIEALI